MRLCHMFLRVILFLGVLSQSHIGFADDRPIVIGHRGASGTLPEHTMEAYKLAVEQGADFIEPDLVYTKDGILVARHDIYLSTTTNVADHSEFAGRKRKVDGKSDWYVSDFTLAEIKTLKARQPFPGRDKSHDDRLDIPTFDEIIAYVETLKAEGVNIGLYPELKQPAFFRAQGLEPSKALLTGLERLRREEIPTFFQCFDPRFLQEMNDLTDTPLILLLYEVESDGAIQPNLNYHDWRPYIDGLGASKALGSISIPKDGRPGAFFKGAKSDGLIVHLWTMRDDQLSIGFETAEEEITFYLNMGIDGFFTDFPATGRRAVDEFWKATRK